MIQRALLAAAFVALAVPTLLSTTSMAQPEASVEVGKTAPDFTLTSTDGKAVTLSELRGKVVVLEWYNPDCPFVEYAHNAEGPLRSLGDAWTEKGVVWLAINSGAEGKQGFGQERNGKSRSEFQFSYPVLLDATGSVGRSYDAKTTPQMVVVDAEGKVAYHGALDNAPLGKVSDNSYVNYLDQALTAVVSGGTPQPAQTKPYGCSVKY